MLCVRRARSASLLLEVGTERRRRLLLAVVVISEHRAGGGAEDGPDRTARPPHRPQGRSRCRCLPVWIPRPAAVRRHRRPVPAASPHTPAAPRPAPLPAVPILKHSSSDSSCVGPAGSGTPPLRSRLPLQRRGQRRTVMQKRQCGDDLWQKLAAARPSHILAASPPSQDPPCRKTPAGAGCAPERCSPPSLLLSGAWHG